MRIGINLVPLRPGEMGGAEVYLRDLLSELVRRGRHQYVLVTADYNHETLPADSAGCRRVLYRREGVAGARSLRSMERSLRSLAAGVSWLRAQYGRHAPAAVRALLRPLGARSVRPLRAVSGSLRMTVKRQQQRRASGLAELIRREEIDLWFCPFTNLEPRVTPVPSVITVHDLQHEYLPEFFDADELRHRRHFYPESCAGADHIIAVSEFTRRSVIDRYGIPAEHVSTIWEAAASDLAWTAGRAAARDVRRRYRLPARYAIYPANTWHHKNHARLIEALAIYREQQGETLALVLTGVRKEGQATLVQAIERHKLTGSVHVLGLVPRADLPGLYGGAVCLVLPSLFEGFGIPLVEAMAVGCPIAASNATAIPEVAGNAAVLFDPLDPEDIARALGAVARDPEAAAKMVERGRQRALRFSAPRMAEETLDVFERVHRERLVRGRAAGRELIVVEGVYDDQWIGGEAMVALMGSSLVSLEIQGELAAIGDIVPQRIAGSVGGEPVLSLRLTSPGPFTATLALPTRAAGSPGLWQISLVPERTFRPCDLGLSTDDRALGVRLSRLIARTGDGREIVKPLGATPPSGSGR